MKFVIALALALAASVNAFDVPSLTPDNYDELTDGKTVFIKFFAPWVSRLYCYLGMGPRRDWSHPRKSTATVISVSIIC
jgi:hypothetical protein